MTSRRDRRHGLRTWRFFIYGAPILWWSIIVYAGATEWGRYERSWALIQDFFHMLAPDWGTSSADGIQPYLWMYEINAALRRLAHVVTYAVLTLLIVRFIQQGEPRLKRASVIGAVAIAVLYNVADEWLRWNELHRHAKAIDVYLNLTGVVCVLGGTFLFFSFKAWERRLLGLPAEAPGRMLGKQDHK